MTVIQFHPNAPDGELPAASSQKLMRLMLDELAIDSQVRNSFDDEDHARLEKLSASLMSSGQITPILTYYDKGRGKYVLIDGERRYRAARAIGWNALEAIVFDIEPTQKEIVLVQLVIDEQREELDPIDKAEGYANALAATGWPASQLAAHIGVSHTTVTRTVSLLDLPSELKAEIRSGTLPVALARELVRLPDDATQRSVLETIKTQGLNTKQAERYIAKLLKPKAKPGRPQMKGKQVYKNLSGFEAIVTAKKLTLTPVASGKPKTPEQMIAAVELLLGKLREAAGKPAAEPSAIPSPAPHA